jgi:hypothetical protein
MYHFITYATPSHIGAALNIRDSANLHGRFDTCQIYTPDDLDLDYVEKNAHILKFPRGAGYWIWKSYVIFKHLQKINDGDVLCYCDTAYLFMSSIRNINIPTGSIPIFLTHNKPNEGSYIEKTLSKQDAFILMDARKPRFTDTKQVWAGFVLLVKNAETLRFVSEWMNCCQDERIVTDMPSSLIPEISEFIENRHDQTVLSILAKKWNINFHDFPKDLLYNIRVPQ